MVQTDTGVDFTKDETILRLLKTPYFPRYTHKQSLHVAVEEQTKMISVIEEKIIELKSQLESLEKERDAGNKKLQNARGLLVPVRKIPVEILSEIFCWVAEKPGYIDRFFPDKAWKHSSLMKPRSISRPLLFLGVCKLWRSVALDTPRLFTHIHLEGRCSGTLSEVVKFYVDHSRTLPLTV
ncbi:hypothetical protein M422DRAFT_216809, partial [Sphaerobolus stellatus SS14]